MAEIEAALKKHPGPNRGTEFGQGRASSNTLVESEPISTHSLAKTPAVPKVAIKNNVQRMRHIGVPMR